MSTNRKLVWVLALLINPWLSRKVSITSSIIQELREVLSMNNTMFPSFTFCEVLDSLKRFCNSGSWQVLLSPTFQNFSKNISKILNLPTTPFSIIIFLRKDARSKLTFFLRSSRWLRVKTFKSRGSSLAIVRG